MPPSRPRLSGRRVLITGAARGTDAATILTSSSPFMRVAPLAAGIDALERGIARRARRVVAPRWVGPLLPLRMVAQPVVERGLQRGLGEALRVARAEHAPLTTTQPEGPQR